MLSDHFLEPASAAALGQDKGESRVFRYKKLRNR